MEHGPELARISAAFVDAARSTESEAPIASSSWPTAGDMVDHLGAIQRWATEVLQTGRSADKNAHTREPGRQPLDWFGEGSERLVAEVESADPDSPCWTIVGEGTRSFWGRRMVHEATKHLWDLRTAHDAAPPMPREVDASTPAAIIDEFDEVFIARARRRGIAPLPGSVLLQADDSPRSWLIEPEWTVVRDAAVVSPSAVLRASTADLALVLWERADPWRLADRFVRSGDDAALRALCSTPVHL